MQNIDGDATYTFTTRAIPAGTYVFKVAIDEKWDVSYGAGGGSGDISFTVPAANSEVCFDFNSISHIPRVFIGACPRGNLATAQAHWVSRDTIAWSVSTATGTTYALHASPIGALALEPTGITGGASFVLTRDPAGLSEELKAKFPHLKNYHAFKLSPEAQSQARDLLKGQLAVSAVQGTALIDATSLQFPGVLDDLYTYTGTLGVTFADGVPTLRVWAPTARSVTLHLYEDSTTPMSTAVPMTADGTTGTWVVTGDASWKNKFYLYEVEVYVRSASPPVVRNMVTDPYSFSLSTNSLRSQIVDIDDPALKPSDWDNTPKPPLDAPEDIVLYELHVRDFSITDATVPDDYRGTFKAFTLPDSNGMKHLQRLASSGLTHIHLLPAFDFATANEDKATRREPNSGSLATYGPNAENQQAITSALANEDGFNWGYDPLHYTVPEGSYATNPDGPARIREFREMVQALNRAKLRVVMDVVYNHTNASGQNARSVLDRIVPGYYHRLNADGNVETSTCCQNTATEHAMMEKLMVDSVVTWATQYKVDGFRFDLMGHHMKSNMLKVRDAVQALTVAQNGMDGSKVYIYGEGWNFGEVANNARGIQATQLNLADTGIGSFSDRLRDAVRGGGPFSPRRLQGFATGLALDPNGVDQGVPAEVNSKLLHYSDQIRVGLAGNLKDYTLVNRLGVEVNGSDVDYNGQPGGYALDPQETITYISAHDNETWFDAIQAKVPGSMPMDQRVRVHNLGNAIVMLSQGIPFFHAGDEVLRSKSGDKNSYDSGDWWNRLDFTYESNNWGVGLPPSSANASDWSVLRPLLGNPALKPAKPDITRALDHFTEMLRIRRSSPLFRLRTGEEIKQAVKLYNDGPGQAAGVIAMGITNAANRASPYTEVLVVFNASPEPQELTLDAYAKKDMVLHPVQQSSTDPVVRTSAFERASGKFKVPGRTTAVFVHSEGGCGCGQANGLSIAALGLVLAAALWTLRRRAAR